MNYLSLIGLMVKNRSENAPHLQEIITRYGSEIICRLGIPSPSKENGLITLIFEGELSKVASFEKELENTPEVIVKTISFPQ